VKGQGFGRRASASVFVSETEAALNLARSFNSPPSQMRHSLPSYGGDTICLTQLSQAFTSSLTKSGSSLDRVFSLWFLEVALRPLTANPGLEQASPKRGKVAHDLMGVAEEAKRAKDQRWLKPSRFQSPCRQRDRRKENRP
jgi:hypothetical protein